MRDILLDIASYTAPVLGSQFLALLVKRIREAMDAKLVLITTGIGDPARRARSMASWQRSGEERTFEYDLEGTPCHLVYGGQILVVSSGLAQRFPKEESYESFIGVPLKIRGNRVGGHFAVFSEKPLAEPEKAEAIVRLFALRAEAELQRLIHESEREQLLQSLARTNRRLASRHNALRQSNETKAMLIGMIAHDLRNPLSVILNRSELISSLIGKGQDSAPRAIDSCQVIMDAAERMDRLIASTLVQARSESETMTLDMQEFPIARAIEAAIALNAVAAERKNIEIASSAPADASVRGDEDRIVEALDNLIRNAIKYSHARQDVEVQASVLPDALEIHVSDHGQGLTPEDCARAFRQFQRLSARPTAGEPSTGLGLSIVKAIAEAHGGTARVESGGRGAGATFTITLPRTLV